MKLGIIGAGLIVEEFLPKLVQIEQLEILGIQSVPSDMDKLKQWCTKYNIPLATSDFEELSQSGIDTVYIAVPNFLHVSFVEKALNSGLNVIVEKPMTSNAKEAQHLKELAQAKGLFLFEAITTRYFKTYQKIREWLPKIGQIKLVESKYSQYSRRYDAFQKGEILPVFDPAKAGGAMMDLNLYNLHFVMGLFGQPENQHYFANVERGIDTSGVAVLNYPDFIAVCTAAKDSKGKSGSLIQGTKGYIETTLSPNLVGEIKLVLNDGSKESFDDGSSQARLIPEFQAFVKMINDNDLEACYKELEASLSVSKVQTQLRKEAGIIFPMDN